MKLDEGLKIYIAESREQLDQMEQGLLRLERDPDFDKTINDVFRVMHTIKGSAGIFGLDEIVAFTHVAENALDRLRDGRLTINEHLTAILLQAKDHVCRMINALESQVSLSVVEQENGETIKKTLCQHINSSLTSEAAQNESQSTPCNKPSLCKTGSEVAADHWHLSIRFGADCMQHGMDPLSFLRFLQDNGEITYVSVIADRLPEFADLDPQLCYLGFEIAYKTKMSKQEIENVFEFVRVNSQIVIVPPRSQISEYLDLIEALPDDPTRLGDLLVRCGSLTENELVEALNLQKERANNMGEESNKTLGAILVEQGKVPAEIVDAGLEKQRVMREHDSTPNNEISSIRVDSHKLDKLINLVGEMVIAGDGANLAAQRAGVSSVNQALAALYRLVGEVRDSALSLRMVQVGGTFNRFQRVVRDVSKELGKDIELVIEGAETELDKTVVEKITDPLTHLVRNAIDHGIETPAQRQAAGKPARGTLKLNAYHESGNIIIEVTDDGAGLNRERIAAKAIEKGLVQPGQTLTDAEVCDLIFAPGLSTADKVTNLSGRGVGMDVVKQNIIALRGSIDVDSALGKGTAIRIRLPLTLAIIDGFHVVAAGGAFVILLDTVDECINFTRSQTDGNYINLRGDVLPLIHLNEQFRVNGPTAERQNVVVVQDRGQRIGIVVDKLLGESQTVIKPLGGIFGQVQGVSGSTILANGEVALILDVPELVRLAAQRENAKNKERMAKGAHIVDLGRNNNAA